MRRIALIGVAIVSVVAATAIALLFVHTDGRNKASPSRSETASEPREAAPVTTTVSALADTAPTGVASGGLPATLTGFRLDIQPSVMTTSRDALWLGTLRTGCPSVCGLLRRFDPATGATVADVVVRKGVRAVTATDDAVWVVMTFPNGSPISVARVDVATDTVGLDVDIAGTSIPGDTGHYYAAVSDDSVWVTTNGLVYRLDPGTGDVTATIRIPGSAAGIAVAHGVPWIADEGGKIIRIDPTTNDVTVAASLPPTFVHGLAYDGADLWLTYVVTGNGAPRTELVRFDPTTGQLTHTDVPTYHVIAGDGQVWIQGYAPILDLAHDDVGYVAKLDPSAQATRSATLGLSKTSTVPAAVDRNGLWLFDYRTSTLLRVT